MAERKEKKEKKDRTKGRGRQSAGPSSRLDPASWQGHAGFIRGSHPTEPAERRSGQIRGQEPSGSGARQAARDPKDGGRPRGKRRR